MAELRASPVVNPSYKRIADVLANLQGPMGEIIPFTDANPFKFLMPAASTFENLAYGNSPLSEYAGVTNRRLPIVKTGRENELTDIADVALMASGLPMASRGVARGANYLGDVLTQATRAAPPAAPMRAVSEIAEAAPITPKPPPPEPVRSDIGFYSQLEAATNPLQDKGTGDQFLSQLQKSAGVKPDEIKYTGLDEFLKGKKAVTKAEIQGYLASNKVDVQEVRLGENTAYQQWKESFSKAKSSQEAAGINMELSLPDNMTPLNYYNLRGMWAAPAAKGDQETLAKIKSLGLTPEQESNVLDYGRQINKVAELKAAEPSNTTPKFSDYTLPGGENYREILLTLPEKKLPLDEFLESAGKKYGGNTPRNQWSAEDNATYERLLKEDPSVSRGYRSGHFRQPNVLAHMRVNDRTVDGKKTLFIEEIQSDWHQAGRKKGYGPQTETTHEAFYTTPDGQKVSLGFGKTQEEAAAAVDPNWKNLVDIKFDSQTVKVDEGVPDAPFKTTWHELTLKRAIQEASEKGYDQIAFTTGKTQVERYPEELRRVADEISWHSMDGKERSVIVRKEGKTVFGATLDENGIIKQSLSKEAVGKPIDEVIGKPMGGEVINKTSGEIKGKDFTVGGKGMEGFYDQILPKSLEKLGKKFDAKVGKTQMDGVEVWQMDITPKMRESVTTKGQPLFSISGLGAGAIGSGFYQDDTMEQLSR
jgi:hypothetical protein